MSISNTLGDGEVNELLRKRSHARERGDYVEADDIREALLWDGVVVEDEDEGQPKWRRFPLALLGSCGDYGCLSWVRKREEFCGQPVENTPRAYFCSEHQKQHKGRVPCPLDPKHSISIAKLAGHLRVCQGLVLQPVVAPLRDSPFGNVNVSAGLSDAIAPQVVPKPPIPIGAADSELEELGGLASRVLTALWDTGALAEQVPSAEADDEFDISTIFAIAAEACEADSSNETERPPWVGRRVRLRPRPTEILLPDICAPLVARAPPEGNRKARNGYHDVLQQASIAGHLDRAGWVPLLRPEGNSPQRSNAADDRLCLVEFGAGSAHLSNLIAQVAASPIDMHMLIDRQANRRTADQRLRQGVGGERARSQDNDEASATDGIAQGAIVERVQCDICNLDLHATLSDMLTNQPSAGNEHLKETSVVAIGKHICGAATDLSMQCCVQMGAADQSAQANDSLERSAPVVAAHFRGMAFALCCHHVCEWSRYVGRQWLLRHDITETDFDSMRWFAKLAHTQYRQRQSIDAASRSDRQNRSISARAAAARAELGHLSKRLIDEGRLAWLREQGWECRLTRFCDRDVSPENGLLLAWPHTAK